MKHQNDTEDESILSSGILERGVIALTTYREQVVYEFVVDTATDND